MSYRVIFTPEAEEQLAALYGYIAVAASPDMAARYTEAIVSCCESLCTFPHRGTMRDDVQVKLGSDPNSSLWPQEKYRAIRSDVQVATPVPKKSASSVQTGQPNVMAQANTGQSSASRWAIRRNACCCMPA